MGRTVPSLACGLRSSQEGRNDRPRPSDGNAQWETTMDFSRVLRVSRALKDRRRDADASARSRARRCRPRAEALEGRYLLTAAIAKAPAPPGDHPGDITAGPDGNLWFNELNAGRIGQVVLDPPPDAA